TGDRTARLEIDLAVPVTVSVARLSENVARGQRVARYNLEGAELETDAWRNLSSGTTIGYTKLDRFPPTLLRRIRLTIEDAVAPPEAVAVKLFALYGARSAFLSRWEEPWNAEKQNGFS